MLFRSNTRPPHHDGPPYNLSTPTPTLNADKSEMSSLFPKSIDYARISITTPNVRLRFSGQCGTTHMNDFLTILNAFYTSVLIDFIDKKIYYHHTTPHHTTSFIHNLPTQKLITHYTLLFLYFFARMIERRNAFG